MTELESLMVVNMVEGIGSIRIKALLEHFGSSREILKASPQQLSRVHHIGPRLANNIVNAAERKNLKKEFELIEKYNVKVIIFQDKDYPESLKKIYDPPIVLYVKGELTPQDLASIAIVGSRRPSFYGLSTAERLGQELAGFGLTIVSGLARGIDTASHKGALKAKGRTIAVLGSGLACIYPPENRPLFERISGSGAVISEFPMLEPPLAQNFPRRNRVISGLCLGVIVVEAARNSGALITANLALEQGREVFAVPGKINSSTSWGTHNLIKDGARLVERSEDIIEQLRPILQNYLKEVKAKTNSVKIQPALAEEEKRVYELLSTEPQHLDRIAHICRLPIFSVSAILSRLEIKRLVRQLPGKRFLRSYEA